MPTRKTPAPKDSLAFAQTRAALSQQLGQIDGVLPGSIVVRQMRCGKATCACKADPPALHGPYIQWTRSVGGKTVTRFLAPEQLSRLRPWFDNARQLKDLVAKLETASIAAVNQLADQAETRPGRQSGRRRPKTLS